MVLDMCVGCVLLTFSSDGEILPFFLAPSSTFRTGDSVRLGARDAPATAPGNVNRKVPGKVRCVGAAEAHPLKICSLLSYLLKLVAMVTR